MPESAANAIVVIAVVMVLWTIAAGVAGFKIWKLLERTNAKLDQITSDVRSLSQKGEQLLAELQKISTNARGQVETVGTIVRDVRGWVDKVETTANLVSTLARHGVTSSYANVKAFFTGMMSFLQFFTRPGAPHPGAQASDVSNGKED
jgi:uncharacterized protein YoxC